MRQLEALLNYLITNNVNWARGLAHSSGPYKYLLSTLKEQPAHAKNDLKCDTNANERPYKITHEADFQFDGI